MQPLGEKNVLKIQILGTIKIQEIGTDHLGLLFVLKIKDKKNGKNHHVFFSVQAAVQTVAGPPFYQQV